MVVHQGYTLTELIKLKALPIEFHSYIYIQKWLFFKKHGIKSWPF